MKIIPFLLSFFIFEFFWSSDALCGHGNSKEGTNTSNKDNNKTLSRAFSQSMFHSRENIATEPRIRSQSLAQIKKPSSPRQIRIHSDLPKAIESLYLDAQEKQPNWRYIKEKMNAIELRLKELEDSGAERYRGSMSDENFLNIKSMLEYLREQVKKL